MICFKKYVLLAFFSISVILPSKSVLAAEITAIDFSGNTIGQVISTGMVINNTGENIGSITAEGLVIDHEGKIIGGAVPQGTVIGNDNRLLGKIHSDGIVRSLSGKQVGKSLPNGLVIDTEGVVIGSVLYPGLIYSINGNTIGRLTSSGDYINLEGQKLGFVSSNGYAYRHTGNEYVLDGRLMPSKMVVADDGHFIGSVSVNGQVIDFEAKALGQIHANGYVYGSDGKIIGKTVNIGYAFDLTGKYLGIVSYNGEVKSGEQTIGYSRTDGNVVNSKNEVIGYSVPLSATAGDYNGKYLGYVVPQGLVMRGNKVVGQIGVKGYVYDTNHNKIGEIIQTGPLYDTVAKLRGQSMKNGTVISLSGGNIGYMRGRYAYDTNGTLIGGISDNLVGIENSHVALGVADIDSSVGNGAENIKVSPFGYLLSNSGKVIGKSLNMHPLYNLEGQLYSYISPNGMLLNPNGKGVLSASGIIFAKEGYVGEQVSPLYTMSFNDKTIGHMTQTNILLNDKGDIAYKVIPGNYIVDTAEVNSANLSPIKGYSGDKLIALDIGGDLIGYADSQGQIIDLSGNQYGQVIFNDYIMDNNKSVSGRLTSFTAVVNEKCNNIGVVNGKGDIINNRDVIVGHILPNGQAISDVGGYIGYSVFERGLIDFNGNFVGVTTGSYSYDAEGKTLGCVNKKGLVVDNEQKQLYGIIHNVPVIDFGSNIIGHILANGQIVNAKNQLIGYVQPNGNVVNKSQKSLGNAMRYTVAFYNDNRFMGMVQNSGEVINYKGEVIGKVKFDGSIYNNDNEIGYALYDFYVYDENFVTYGYLTKDGTVLSMVGSKIGQIDRGFVLDKKHQIVARGNRDYIVRDYDNNAVGELQLDGTVINFEGQNIGYLSEAGIIRDSNSVEVAHATPLQYYMVRENGLPRTQDWADGRQVKINDAKLDSNIQVSEAGIKQQNLGNRIVGIALNPDGDIIGNIYSDDTVRRDDGTQIGFRTPDGIIVDMNYNPIGIEEVKHISTGNMFIPENAFGSGNPYGIGSQPSNLGPGGGYGQGERYDPVRSRALAELQSARRRSISVGQVSSNVKVSSFTGYEEDGWPGVGQNISTWRVDMSEMILEDKPIPAVLARSVYAAEGFSSNIPVTAIVERNVYAEEGRNIIIPAGSRVIGSLGGGTGGSFDTTGGNSGGAVKIGISWKRLIRPDGSQFTFSSAQTADAQGRAGAIGYLDEQLLKRYSMPMLTSMLESGMAYIMASGSGTKTTDTSTTTGARSQAAEDARQNFLDQMNNIFEEILERKANIRSVTYVPAGTRIIIFPNQDLWLNSRTRDKSKAGRNGEEDIEDGETGLVKTNLSKQDASSNVTYSGNYQENVQPVSAPSGGNNGGGAVPTGRNPTGYIQPAPNSKDAASDMPPSITTQDSTDDVPELL